MATLIVTTMFYISIDLSRWADSNGIWLDVRVKVVQKLYQFFSNKKCILTIRVNIIKNLNLSSPITLELTLKSLKYIEKEDLSYDLMIESYDL